MRRDFLATPQTHISHSLLNAVLCSHVDKFLIFRHCTEPRMEEISEDVIDDCAEQIIQLRLPCELPLLVGRRRLLCDALPFAMHLDPVHRILCLATTYFERGLFKQGF